MVPQSSQQREYDSFWNKRGVLSSVHELLTENRLQGLKTIGTT